MAVVRVNKNKDYTVMSNYHLRTKDMSLKAKGLMSLMLSLPDDWDYSVKGLEAICKEGRDSINAALSELKRFGFLKIEKVKGEDGKFSYLYNIYEYPVSNENIQKPATEKPATENPATENPQQLNTNNQLLNNKLLNNKDNGHVCDANNDDIKAVVDYLNKKTGKSFRATSAKTKKLISARIKDGFTVSDFERVIDNKTSEWSSDPKMEKYLRPETLFGTKFESYLNERQVQPKSFTGFYGSYENEEEW